MSLFVVFVCPSDFEGLSVSVAIPPPQLCGQPSVVALREGGREEERERGREGGRKRERKRGGGREEGREGGRERGKEGGREETWRNVGWRGRRVMEVTEDAVLSKLSWPASTCIVHVMYIIVRNAEGTCM